MQKVIIKARNVIVIDLVKEFDERQLNDEDIKDLKNYIETKENIMLLDETMTTWRKVYPPGRRKVSWHYKQKKPNLDRWLSRLD
jgi:hypothetical protein